MSLAIVFLAVLGSSLQAAYGHYAYPIEEAPRNLNAVAEQYQLFTLPDPCMNITAELPVFHQVLVDGGSLIGKLATNLTTTWINSVGCLQINWHTIPCLIESTKEYRAAFEAFHTEIVEYNKKLLTEIGKYFVIVKMCVDSLTHKD